MSAEHADRCAMAIMAKAPRVGSAKTRLVPALSAVEAAQLSACFIRDAAENIAAAGRRAKIDGYIAYAPADAAPEFAALVGEATRLLPSRRAGLGASLVDAAADLFAAGYGAVCLVNSDSPTLPAEILVEAARALALPGDRLALGPAEDGGYYLIGLKQPHARLFEGIAWSTARVFAQTLARAREIGIDPVVLPTWYDVDDVASLHRAHGEMREQPAHGTRARHTAAFLQSLMEAGRAPRVQRSPFGTAAGSNGA